MINSRRVHAQRVENPQEILASVAHVLVALYGRGQGDRVFAYRPHRVYPSIVLHAFPT